MSRAASNESFGIRPFAGHVDAGLIDGAPQPGGDERPVVRDGGVEGGLQRERWRGGGLCERRGHCGGFQKDTHNRDGKREHALRVVHFRFTFAAAAVPAIETE